MGAIVRLLPRLFLLGLAAGALLVLADRARDAHAQAPHPPTAPPALSPPRVPDAPDTPDVDAGTVTGAVGALPAVPTVAPPEPLLPQLPELPQLPDVPGLPDVPQVPEVPELPAPRQAPDGVLGLSAAPAPIAPSPSAAPRRPSSAPAAEPPPAGVASTEASGVPAGLDTDVVAARAPPRVTPSRHPCPDGETSEPTDADQAACLASGVDDANRGGESFSEPRATHSFGLTSRSFVTEAPRAPARTQEGEEMSHNGNAANNGSGPESTEGQPGLPDDDLLTSAEVASLFGVDRRTVVLWAKRGRIPALRTPGGQHRFRAEEIRTLLERNENGENGDEGE